MEINHLVYDTRMIFNAMNSLFIGISTKNGDGNAYFKEAFKKGIRNFIFSSKVNSLEDYANEINYCIVDDAIEALQKIAIYKRQNIQFPIIAVTGSNGKTIIKEWLSEILSENFKVVKSPKSYNSQIGVAISLWQINSNYEIGVFEAGISKSGEMSNLQKMLKPDFGILSNIGSAHDEGFVSKEEKLKEKLKLFKDTKVLICREIERDDVLKYSSGLGIKKILSWGESDSNDYVVSVKSDSKKSIVSINTEKIAVSFTDKASLENICHCIILAKELKVENFEDRLSQLKSIPMRLELKDAENDCKLIDDSYNHDLAGLEYALSFLKGQFPELKKSAILSEFKQSNLNSEEQINYFNNTLSKLGLKNIILIGEGIFQKRAFLNPNLTVFRTTSDFLNDLGPFNFSSELILVKGARDYKFENIVQGLERKIHGTKLEINLSSISNNLNQFKNLLNSKTKLMVMVKAFAYGAGSREVANLLEFHNVNYMGVAYANEGVELRQMGIKLPIFVMNPSPDSIHLCFKYDLEPEIYSIKGLKHFIELSKVFKKELPIHLNIDTGMKRLGFEQSEISDLIIHLKDSNLNVKSIFSHLAASDEPSQREFTKNQIDVYEKVFNQISSALNISPLKHILNTAGILNYPEYQFDMVRLGLGLYGINNSSRGDFKLEQVGKLTSEISQIKTLNEGETVGYSRRGHRDGPGKIATIPIGYADGYSRVFGNGCGKVFINGRLAPVIGNICMDMTMIDITGIEAEEGDEIELMGPNIAPVDLAEMGGTIAYEILTNISERVKRIYITD